jgi:hypothetical protein
MRLLFVAVFSLVYLPLAVSQQNKPSGSVTNSPSSTNLLPPNTLSQPFPLSGKEFKKTLIQKSPDGVYGPSDYLLLSNSGVWGELIMGLGDEFNGVLIGYKVCDVWKILAQSGSINWGDGTPDTVIYFIPPLGSSLAGTTKTPQKIGIFPVTAKIYGYCEDTRRGNTYNSVSGSATAYVYDSIPISSFVVNCDTTANCTSIKGGQIASGVVTTTMASPSHMGTLVRITASGPATSVPSYMIEPSWHTTISFDIPTVAVKAPTPLSVTVNSGDTIFSQTITVIP